MNKSKLMFFVIGLFFSIKLCAQNNFKIGINAGLNYPDIRGNEVAKYNNFKVGYLFGLSFDYYFKENLSLKANINYERKFKRNDITYFNYEAEIIGSDVFIEIYEYLNLPILLKYEFGKSRFFANCGPFLNYLLSNKIDSDYPNNDSNFFTEQKNIDFGFSIGIGTKISLNEKNDLVIEIRDDFGIVDTGDAPKNLGGTVKTNTIKLIFGWNLGI